MAQNLAIAVSDLIKLFLSSLWFEAEIEIKTLKRRIDRNNLVN